MAQNNEYQNANEEEPFYDDPKQTKIPRTSKFCLKIIILIHGCTMSQERNTNVSV